MPCVQLKEASVVLPVYGGNSRSFRASVMHRAVGSRLNVSSSDTVQVIALRSISMELNDGTRLGLIGSNGAGKTSLLRLIAGIYPPCSGSVRVDGSVGALTDIMLGMDDEATGYENIVIRGVLMGLTNRQARALTPEIEEFTGLGEYLALPLRTYSAGMRLRLAFALTTAFEPEILLMDEMIGVGDAAFISAAHARLEAMIHRASIFVLASHVPEILKKFCDRAAWMEQGTIIRMGPIDDVLDVYVASLARAQPHGSTVDA
jgi:ABC-2 type transport system ATP-binding protein/lipopolysaccharide transport system ATP-binding protein